MGVFFLGFFFSGPKFILLSVSEYSDTEIIVGSEHRPTVPAYKNETLVKTD